MMTLSICGNLFAWVERKTHSRHYPLYLTITLVCISLFLAFPRYDRHWNSVSWETTFLKADDLTNNLQQIPPDSYLAKKVFRLTVPVIIHVLHLNRTAVLAIQFIIGVLLLYFAYQLALRIMHDPVSATLFTAGLTFLYCGHTCFTEITYTWFDGWAYFFLLMACYFKRFLPVFLFATLAAWTDERALIILPITVLFHQIDTKDPQRFRYQRLLTLNKSSIAVFSALGVYALVRTWLSHRYHMYTPNQGAGFMDLKKNILHNSFGFGAFTFLEGFWLLAPLTLFFSWKNKHYTFLSLLLVQLTLSSVVAFCVADLTRSGSYIMPVLFIFLVYLVDHIETWMMRPLLLICLFFSLIFPPINYISFSDLSYQTDKPFPWVLYSIMTGYIK